MLTAQCKCKVFIRSNLAKNCPISMEDMDLAEKLFGIDVPACKGKWTRPKNKIINSNKKGTLVKKMLLLLLSLC